MSDTNENKAWNDLNPTEPENTFSDWLGWEDRFGEFGEPGYKTFIRPTTAPKIFGHNNPVDLEFHIFRGEDGLLLCINANYYDADGVLKPFVLHVHPDHLRKGIAKRMVEYSLNRIISQQSLKHLGPKYGYTPEEFEALPLHERASLIIPDMFIGIKTNNAGASFINPLFSSMVTPEISNMVTVQDESNESQGGETR